MTELHNDGKQVYIFSSNTMMFSSWPCLPASVVDCLHHSIFLIVDCFPFEISGKQALKSRSSRSSMEGSIIGNFCAVFWGVYFLYGPQFLSLAHSVICLATSSTWLLTNSIQEEGSCLDKGPCRFGRQLLVLSKIKSTKTSLAVIQHFVTVHTFTVKSILMIVCNTQ